MWYFWIDQHRKGGGSDPDDRRAKIHVYAGEDLGGGHVPLKTGCGRMFLAKEANIVSNRAIKILRGRICKKCFPTVRATEVAERFAE
jgi:hypothetical protein